MATPERPQFEWVKLALDSFDALRARKWLIIVVTVVAASASAVREITTPSYGAEALVAVTPLTAKGDLIQAVPETFEPKAYERLFLSSTVIGLVRERLIDEAVFEGDPPPVDDLRLDFTLNVDLLDQTTRPVSFSPILRLHARAKSPERAVAKLRAWADTAIEIGNKALSAKINAASETLTLQRGQFEATLDELRGQLRNEKANWNLDVIEKNIALTQERLNRLVQERQLAEQSAAAARSQILVVESALANEKPVRVYRRSPSDDALFIAEGAGGSADAIADDVMITEAENLVYTNLKNQEHKYRATEAEATAKLDRLEVQIESTEEALRELESDLAEHEIVQDRLTGDIAIAQTVYSDIAQASSFSDAAQSLTQEIGDSGERAVGLNLVSDRLFPLEYEGVFGSRLSVIFATLTAFSLIVVFVLLRDVGVPWLRAYLADHAES